MKDEERQRWAELYDTLGGEVPAEAPPAATPAPTPEEPAPAKKRRTSKKAAATTEGGEGAAPARKRRTTKKVVLVEEVLVEEVLVAESQPEPEVVTGLPAAEVAALPFPLPMEEEPDLASPVEVVVVTTPEGPVSEAGPAESSEASPEGEEERKRKRRRRRRRGKGGAAPQAGPTAAAAVAVAPRQAEDEDEEDEPAEGEVAVAQDSGGKADDDGDEVFEDLTNLPIPPWSELIAGLYRPHDR